jgi:putative transposase
VIFHGVCWRAKTGVMKNETPIPASQALALERFAFITQIPALLREGFPLAVALEQVSYRPFTLPDGTQRLHQRRTIEDWWYADQHGGFAGLCPKERADKGQPRLLTPEQQKGILEQAQAHLPVPVKGLYRRWSEQDPQLPSLSSIYRFLREHELNTKARRAQLRQPLGGATKCFEAPFVHDLWMTDFSPGPYLHPTDGAKAIPTHLCVILDDHSRLIPYAAYYLHADTQAFHQTLKEALRRRGVPAKLYTDQGGPFTNDHTRVVCANLGIRLLHAKPYHAWSKGKAERVLFTIQQDFEASLRLPGQGVASLEELNAKFSLWLQSVYHARVHSSTHLTPVERYQRGAHLVKALDPHLDLEQLFYHQLTRTVRRDGTVRLDNQLYEVDLSLRTLEVQLRFAPFRLDRSEVRYRGTAFGLAQPLNAQLNRQLPGGDAYEKRTESRTGVAGSPVGSHRGSLRPTLCPGLVGNPARPARPGLAGPNRHAAERPAPGRAQRRGQERPGGPLVGPVGPALVLSAALDPRQPERLRPALGPGP